MRAVLLVVNVVAITYMATALFRLLWHWQDWN